MQKNVTIAIVVNKNGTHLNIQSDFPVEQTSEILTHIAKLITIKTPNVKSNYSS